MIGKGIFLWMVPYTLKGDPQAIADWLHVNGFERVDIKVCEGPKAFAFQHTNRLVFPWHDTWGENVDQKLIDAIRARGIKIYGWGAPYGYDPVGEANIAATQIQRFGLDGYILDVESEYERSPSPVASAYTICRTMRKLVPNLDLWFCGYPFWHSPTGSAWHPKAIHSTFMELCDGGMPMAYWEGTTPAQAVSYARKCFAQWREITSKPIAMAGRVYVGDGGTPTPEAMIAFEQVSRELGAVGTSWWAMDYAVDKPQWASALASMQKFNQPVVPPTELKWEDVPSTLKDQMLKRLCNEHGYIKTT
jgi:hypothetical protein